MNGFSNLYRISHGIKISSFRLLVYPLFGLVIGGAILTPYAVIDVLVIFFGIAAASFFNDYYDWKLLGEKNSVAERGRQSLVPGFAPLLFAIVGIVALGVLRVRTVALVALWVSCVLSFLYSVPPVRLKHRRWLGLFAPPTGIFLLYAQGAFLLYPMTMFVGSVSWFVFLFAWYLEFLHLLEDSYYEHEVHKISETQAMWGLRVLAYIGIGSGIILGYYYPIFLLSGFAWIFRLYGVSRYLPQDIGRARRSVLHPIWHLEDFAVYALVAMMGILHILL